MEGVHLEIYSSHVLFKRVNAIGRTVRKKTEYILLPESVLQCHISAPRVGRKIQAESIPPGTLAVSKRAIT